MRDCTGTFLCVNETHTYYCPSLGNELSGADLATILREGVAVGVRGGSRLAFGPILPVV